MTSTDLTIKFLATGVGRDRINKLAQYIAQFLEWYFKRQGVTKDTVDKISKLKTHLGIARKLMNVGRQMEMLRGAEKAWGVKDPIVRYTTVAKLTGMALWLTCDNASWANTVGIIKLSNPKDVTDKAMQAWFVALVSSLIGGVYKYRTNAVRLDMALKARRAGTAKGVKDEAVEKEIGDLEKERFGIVLGLLQDTLDISVPVSALNWYPLESGMVGLAGIASAAIGIYTHSLTL
ncbi:hypothetical protein SeMB42_g03529 [Synchytrium endobioticum]|uniref:Peroxisomal biogenesis factor 11 n=1 Tax=Synchytrium endobioticum TaxID=286115 RepID=A0A507D5W3_9FUNG|nr:hypothetical protein SeMB42_g03529 [Synchytrium endobioticum]TPX51251.1 hypothetical protein SeLEV6574_g00373 [Synchytrium endobioticum]